MHWKNMTTSPKRGHFIQRLMCISSAQWQSLWACTDLIYLSVIEDKNSKHQTAMNTDVMVLMVQSGFTVFSGFWLSVCTVPLLCSCAPSQPAFPFMSSLHQPRYSCPFPIVFQPISSFLVRLFVHISPSPELLCPCLHLSLIHTQEKSASKAFFL